MGYRGVSRADALGTLIEKLVSSGREPQPEARPQRRRIDQSTLASTTTPWARSSRSWFVASTRRTTKRRASGRGRQRSACARCGSRPCPHRINPSLRQRPKPMRNTWCPACFSIGRRCWCGSPRRSPTRTSSTSHAAPGSVRGSSRNLLGGTGRIAGLDIDQRMIEVARKSAGRCAVPIQWHCASALSMPFDVASFDLCLCLQGLQFLPDRTAGLAELRRVLKPTGRLVASIWGPLEANAGHRAVVAALERQGVDATAAKRACSFADPEEIRAAAVLAGFRQIALQTEDGTSRFESISTFSRRHDDRLAFHAPCGRAPAPRRGDPSSPAT